MTAPSSFLHEHLASASPDLLRQMLTTSINTLMSAEADALSGAGYGESSPDRMCARATGAASSTPGPAPSMSRSRNCGRDPNFPDWLLERRRRAERALTTVVATCCLLGASTRQMEKLVESLGITRLSKSQVSTMAAELDAHVADIRGPSSRGAAGAVGEHAARNANAAWSSREEEPPPPGG